MWNETACNKSLLRTCMEYAFVTGALLLFFFTACYPLLCNLYVAKCSAKAAKSAEPLELFEQSTVKKLLQFIYIKDFKDTKAIPQLSRYL